jgi:Cu/Ag efflux protein CusF
MQPMQTATAQPQQNILTYIDGEPLFRTIQQAIDYGQSIGLQGYHTHTFRGTVGYMAGFDHSQATTTSTQESVLKKITSLDIDLSILPNEGANRIFSIFGDDGASFIVQVVSNSNTFYNFQTRTFVATSTRETLLKNKISGVSFSHPIYFPSGGSSYNIIVMPNPTDKETEAFISNGNGAINKKIDQVTDTTITFSLSTANTSSYATLPTLTNLTGSKAKTNRATVNRDFDVENTATAGSAFGLKLSRQILDSDFVFEKTQTVDGAISSSKTVVLDSIDDLVVGMVVTAVTTSSLSGTPTIKKIDVPTKTITLSRAQTFADGITMTFHARGFKSIARATGALMRLRSVKSTEEDLTTTVRTDVSSGTQIEVNSTRGISAGNTYSGAGVDNSSANTVTNVDTPSLTAGRITVSAAQTLIDGTKLRFKGSTKKITTKMSLEVFQFPKANATIKILLDNFITIGTQT